MGLSFVSLAGLLGSLHVELTIRACAAAAALVAIVWGAVVMVRNQTPLPMSVRERRLVVALIFCVLLPIVLADAYFVFQPVSEPASTTP